MMRRRRLDAELVRRGLAANSDAARKAVREGLVTMAGAPATKAATLVRADQPLAVGSRRPFVSRAGGKLRAALDRFAVGPAGWGCLDAGSSTGGFTDCLLQAGASRVAAVDVGYGQLVWELRTDPRVTVIERTNVRSLTRDLLGFEPDLVVADLSFISILTVLPTLAAVSGSDATFVVLIKPQFEANTEDVERGGVVRDPAVWRRVLSETTSAFAAAGVAPQGLMASPLVGPAGNVEFLMHARRGAAPLMLDIDAAVAEGEAAGR